MDVRLTALLLNIPSQPDFSELIKSLEDYAAKSQINVTKFLSGEKIEGYCPEKEPLLAFADYNSDYFAGLIIRVKDVDRLLELSLAKGKLLLDAKELAEETKSVETNFFLLRKDGDHVLYQHYHGATHPNKFCALLNRNYALLISERRKKINEDLKSKLITSKEAEIQKAELKSMDYAILSDSRTIPQMIDSLQDINKVKFVRKVVNFDVDEMRTLADQAKSESVELTFSSSSVSAKIKHALKKMYNDDIFKRLRVEGMEPGKIDKVIDLFNNYDYIDKKDFNDVSDGLVVDFNNLEKSINGSSLIKWIGAVSLSKSLQSRLRAPRHW